MGGNTGREETLAATILLVRHAEHGDLGHRLTGRGPESGLTDAGHVQAGEVAAALREAPVAAVYASPRLRTRQTAEAIARPHGLPVCQADALDEIEFGEWTGRSFAELDGDPDWDRWNSERSLARCPGGESMAEAQERAAAFTRQAAERHGNGAVVLVTHCDIIRALLCRRDRRSLDEILEYEAGPGSITRLELGASHRVAA